MHASSFPHVPCRLWRSPLFGGFFMAVVLLVAQPRVRAEGPAEFSDVVVLNDGSYVRGTLVEFAKGEYVVLLTRGGQTRRFDAHDLTYAGPADAMPTNAPPPPSDSVPVVTAARADSVQQQVEDPPAQLLVRFEARVPVEVYRRTGVNTSLGGAATGEAYAPLCNTPCTFSLEPGTHTFGASLTGKAPRRAGTLTVTRPSTIEVDYQSRLGVRVGGLVFMLGGNAAGLTLMFSNIEDDGSLGGGFWGGAVLSGISMVAGLVMARMPDRAEVRHAR